MYSWWQRLGAFIAMLTVMLAILPLASAAPVATRESSTAPGLWNQNAKTAEPSSNAPGVLFLGMSGLKPSDLDLQGNQLGEMLVPYTFSALSTRSFRIYTCPTEGWMQLRARGDVADEEGRRLAKTVGSQCLGMKLVKGDGTTAQTPVQVEPAAATPLPNAAAVTYAQFKGRTENITWPTRGIFATDAWAIGRNAGIPLANRRGQVAHWLPLPVVPEMARINPSTLDSLYNERTGAGARAALAAKAQQPTSPLGKTLNNRTSLESAWQSLLAAAPSDVVVDLDTVDTAVLNQNTYDTAKTLSLQQLSAILSANQSTAHPRPVIIASLGDFEGARSLQLLAAQTPGLAPTSGEPVAAYDGGTAGAGVLYTSTTRAAGLATLADVRGLVLNARTYLNPKVVPPANITLPELSVTMVASVAEACSVITEQQRHASSALRANSRWYQVFHLFAYLAIGALIVWAFASRYSRRWANSWWVVRLLGLIAFAMLPTALILNWIPWWNLPGTDSTVGAIGIALALTAVITAVLVASLWRSSHAVAFLAGISLCILALDIILGSAHQRNGFMGSLVLSSRRYYGISNRTYIILIAGALLALLPVLQRFWGKCRAGWITGGLGVAVLLIDALPGWGADFGGPPGILLAFGIVALIASGIRLRWWHAGLWVLLTLTVMGAIGWLSRGSDSHIGNFWSNLGSSESRELIAGKVRDVLRSFANNLSTVVFLGVIAAVIVVAMIIAKRRQLSRPQWASSLNQLTDVPALRVVALGIFLGMVVAVPINDSGMMIVKESIYLVLPALSAVIAQHASKLNFRLESGADK